ncbi:hypothetical protein [Aliivibrio fischeri]|uniref:hypothetical protein n=1 Tax=Aliivibrio fischeri TaxID=668 RepID=UPI0012D8E22C|nr:hypothetical protein [Aliivibrio fischeri]MUJ21951.1 hypothetical protein [Aliivibrio fischeri]
MIIFKIIFWLSISVVGAWFSSDAFFVAFGEPEKVVTIVGVLNLWGSVTCTFLGVYVAYYFIMELLKSPISHKQFNIIGVSLAIIIAPLLTLGVYSKSLSNVSSYVECDSLREVSSRYSSRTYAVSDEVCLKVVIDEKQ